jgi:transcriptional regulator with XRE-family HTH domain
VSTFGDNLRAIIKKGRWRNQSEAAKFLGLHQTLLGRYFRGKSEPLVTKAADIARKLDVSLDELAGLKQGQGGGAVSMLVREERARYAAEHPVRKAMERLRDRWRKRPEDREAIEHLVALVFPDDAAAVTAWLKQS